MCAWAKHTQKTRKSEITGLANGRPGRTNGCATDATDAVDVATFDLWQGSSRPPDRPESVAPEKPANLQNNSSGNAQITQHANRP